jgi:ribosome biogenesis GTPase / thiamine phosphate phosphatase
LSDKEKLPPQDLPSQEEEQPEQHESSEESSVERIRRGHEDRSRARRKTLKHRSRAKFTTGVESNIDKTGLSFLRVIRSEGAYFICQAQNGSLQKARTFRGTQTANPNSTLVAVGDLVALESQAEGDDVVHYVEQRRTKLSRKASGRKDNFEQVVVANVDLLVVVASIYDPPLRPGIIDRFIVAGLQGGLDILIAINKIDIASAPAEQEVINEFITLYRSLGYGSVGVSATKHKGIEELREAIRGKISVFAGHSGVGKSSLVNALLGTEKEKIGDLQRKFNRGAHTTTSSVLREVPGEDNTFVVDTPGVREFANFELDSENLKFSFVEFLPYQEHCKITNCTHIHEPGCAVLQAVEDDKIHVERYSSYTKLYDEAKKEEKKQINRE